MSKKQKANWWNVPSGTILYHILSTKYLKELIVKKRLLLTSLSRWNATDNIEANLLNRHWVKFDPVMKRPVCLSLENLIEQYYSICFTMRGETKKMWDGYGTGDGLDIGVRIGIDSDKLRDAVRMFLTSHRCLFAQTDGGLAHEDDSCLELNEKLETCMSKFVLLDHVTYKTAKRLSADRSTNEQPFNVACKPIKKIGLPKMMSKAFEDETRLILKFGCDILQDFLPLRFEDLSIIKSYTVNPNASEAQLERVKGILFECGEINKLTQSKIKKN